MSFRIKILLFSMLSVLIGMSLVTLIALSGINNLRNVASTNVANGLLGVNRLVIDSLLSGTTSLETTLTVNQFAELLTSLKIGDKGFMFVASQDGRLIGIGAENAKTLGAKGGGFNILNQSRLQDSTVPDVAKVPLPTAITGPNSTSTTAVDIQGSPYEIFLRLTSFQTKTQAGVSTLPLVVGFVVSKDEILASLNTVKGNIDDSAQSIFTNQLLVTLGVLVLVLTLAFLLFRPTIRTLRTLTTSTALLRQRNYLVKIPVTSKDEFGQLSEAFNEMASEINNYTHNLEEQVAARTLELEGANSQIMNLNKQLTSENSRLKAEVEITRRLQQMLLPKDHELSDVLSLDITGFMNPAEEVGGDYYDVLQEAGRIKIGIGDVTGHGLESGVLMLMVQTAVRTLLISDEKDPVRFMDILNRTIYANVQRMDSDKNLTLLLLDYNQLTGNMRLSGQHEEAIILRQNGQLEMVDTLKLGFPIGLEENIHDFVSEVDIKLEPGDVVVLYTDGITEAFNAAREQYGLTRLCEVIKCNHERSSAEIKQAVIENLRDFVGEQKVYDDVTLVVLKQR